MRLSFRERLRLAWELTWPLSLIDLAMVVVIHGAINAQGEVLDSLWALVAFFGVSPWVVRRALAQPDKTWRVEAVSRGVAAAKLTYQQSLKVMWLLSWRTIPLALAALFVFSALFKLLGVSVSGISAQDPLVNAAALSLVDFLTSMVLYPLLIPGMLKKRYRGFRLEVKR
jgi:hypothetical protein